MGKFLKYSKRIFFIKFIFLYNLIFLLKNKLKKTINYENILQKIKDKIHNEDLINSFETIKLDIIRTPFDSDVEKKRLVINKYIYK